MQFFVKISASSNKISAGGDLGIKYRLDLSDEKKEVAIQIALESEGNVHKRKIATPILLISGIFEIILAVYFLTNSRFVSGLNFLIIGVLILLFALKAKSFLRPVMGKIFGLPLRNMAQWGSIYMSKGKIIN